jgi:broad specificity phosphatase PhoE
MRRPSLLVLVRHGESERQIAKGDHRHFPNESAVAPLRGKGDHFIELTAAGVHQATETGRYLRQHVGTFDHAYHSGYARTRSTLEKILEAYPPAEREKIEIHMSPFVRERDAGYTYEMTAAQAAEAFPWYEAYYRTAGGFFARPPGGESYADVAQRLRSFLNYIYRDRAGERVLVTTHAGTLRCFRFLLERWSYAQTIDIPPHETPHNCGITVYAYDRAQQRLRLHEYNTTCWR